LTHEDALAGMTVLRFHFRGAFFFTWSRLAAQYLRMRSDIARRFAGVSRFLSRRSSAGSFGFDGGITPACLDDPSALTELDRFDGTSPDAARFGGIAGAISMPNIAERSALASTFAPAGRLPVFERSDAAFAIKSC
jgi:hypothetical protein